MSPPAALTLCADIVAKVQNCPVIVLPPQDDPTDYRRSVYPQSRYRGRQRVLSSRNEVPHIFTRKSRVQPKEILITSAKRLFQQHRSTTAVSSALASGLLHLDLPTLLMRIGAYAPQHAIIQSSHSGFEVDGEPEACRFLDWDVVAKQLDSLDH